MNYPMNSNYQAITIQIRNLKMDT